MFGVVPKSIWNKLNAADENNMCSWALRSWLIEDAGKLILVDCGMGNKQSEKFFGHYYLHGDDNLTKASLLMGFIGTILPTCFNICILTTVVALLSGMAKNWFRHLKMLFIE